MLGTTGLAGGGDRDPDLLGVDLLERGTGATLRDLPLGGVPLGHAKPRGRAELVGDRQHPLDETLDTLKAHQAKSDKPFFAVLHPAHEGEYIASIQGKFHERDIPVFASFERAAAALRRVYDYHNGS